MTFERPPYERPPRADEALAKPAKKRFNPLLIFGIAVFAVAAFYVLIIVATIADDIFLPGNELPAVLSPFESEDPEAADINQRINILVLGLDRRVDEPEGQAARADTVFVLTVDPFSKTAGVFNIPRDLLVDIPDGNGGYVTDRINVVWELGEFTYQGYPGGGPGLIKDTIDHNFGIPVDYYTILDFADFIELVDEVGGIDVDVPNYLVDYAYAEALGGPYYAVEFLEGPEHMDGTRALAYARIRKGSNDFERIERQQAVIRATAKKALTLDLILKPGQAVDLYNAYKDAVQTDIPNSKVLGLALLAKDIDLDNARMVSIAEATYPCGAQCTGAVLLADWDKVEELKAQVFADGKIQQEGALVELQNATDDPALAENVATLLRKQGIAAEDMLLGDAATVQTGTLIVDRSGKDYTARKLAEWLNLSGDSVVSSTNSRAAGYVNSTGDIVVVLGADASQATAALTTQ